MKTENDMDSAPSASGILCVLVLYLPGVTMRWGRLTWWGLALVLAATALTVWLHFRPKWQGPRPQTLLLGILLAGIFTSLCFETAGLDQLAVPGVRPTRFTWPGIGIKFCQTAAFLLALTWLRSVPRVILRLRFPLLLALALAAHVFILFSSPNPAIDVFVSQTDGAKGFMEGKSVYAMTFIQPAPNAPSETIDHFGYPPATVYFNALSLYLFNDVRALWVVCVFIGAACLYYLARKMRPAEDQQAFAQLLPLAFLFLPRGLFFIEQSWTEPLVIAALGCLALAIAHNRAAWLTGPLLALFVTGKQYCVLAIPMLLKLRRLSWRVWLLGALIACALAVPFAVWDWDAMWHDNVVFFLKSEGRVTSLSLYGFIMEITGQGGQEPVELPWTLVATLWFAGIIFFTLRMPRNLAGMLFSIAGTWMFFFLFGKQAFYNYFHLILFTLLLAAAACPEEQKISDS